MQPATYFLALGIASTTAILLALYAIHRRTVPGAWVMVALMLAAAVWSTGYALELGAKGVNAKLFWAKVQYFSIATIAPIWFVFAYYSVRYGCPLFQHPRQLTLLAVVPVTTVFLVWTNEVHGLMWREIRVMTIGPLSLLDPVYGPWFWVHTVYSYLLLLLGALWMIAMLSDASRLYRRQALIILLGMLPVWIANIGYLIRWSPFPSLDLTPFGFAAAGLVYAWGILRFQLLEIVQIAHKAVLNGLGDSVIVVDLENRIIDLNPAAQRLAHIAPNQLIGRPLKTILGKYADLTSQPAGAGPSSSEINLGDPDSPQYYELQLFPLIQRDRKPLGQIVVLHEITVRKQMEEQLRQNQWFLAQASHLGNVGIWLYEPATRKITWSDELYLLHGYESNASSVTVEQSWEHIYPEDRAKLAQSMLLLDEQPEVDVEWRILRPDGEVRYTQNRVTRVTDSSGRIRQLVGIVQDITERKQAEQALYELNQSLEQRVAERTQALQTEIVERRQAEEALQQSEARNRAILDAIPDLIFRIRQDGTYLDVKPAEAMGLYVPQGQFLGKPIADVMPPEIAQQVRRAMSQARQTRQVQTFNYQLLVEENAHFYEARMVASREDEYVVIVRDVTAREAAEQRLRYEAGLLDIVSDAIISTDSNFLVRTWNRAAEQMYGYSTAEVMSRPVSEFVKTQYIRQTAVEVTQQFEREGAWQGEVIQKNKDGHAIDVWSAVKAINDRTGQVIGAVAVNRDVTPYKQAERALRESEARYRELVESTHDLIQSVDPTGHFQFVNRAWFDLLGYTAADLPAITLWDVVHPDEYAHCQRVFEELAGGTLRKPVQTILRTKHGTNVIVEGTATARHQDGNFVGTYTFFRDITEQVEAEEGLQRAEARYRHLFEDAPVMYVITHNEAGMPAISDCNELFLTTLGYTRAEVLGRPMADFYSPASRQELLTGGYQRALAGELEHAERQLITRDGQVIDTHFQTRPEMSADGQVIGTRATFVDFTYRKRIEARLRQTGEQLHNLTQHLQSVREEEQGRIAREIHDELGQMLTALKIDANWLAKRLLEGQKPLRTKVEAMSQLISTTIQSVQRISAELRPGVLDNLGLVAAMQWQLQEFQTRTEILCHLITDLDEKLNLDAGLATALFRIFQEALTNVARHAQATDVTVSFAYENDSLHLRITDNGIGINRRQLASPQSFGLIGMRERLYPWRGQLDVEGAPGQGTTVCLRVPLHSHLEETPA